MRIIPGIVSSLAVLLSLASASALEPPDSASQRVMDEVGAFRAPDGTTWVPLSSQRGDLLVQGSEPVFTSEDGSALVQIAKHAADGFEIRDVESALSTRVLPGCARESVARGLSGTVIFPEALCSGGHSLHVPVPAGLEEWLVITNPVQESVWRVELGEKVAGLRLVSGVLELLDAQGAPRIRMARPFAVDVAGRLIHPMVSVRNCAVDLDPAGPWGRPTIPPGSRSCEVVLSWDGMQVSSPLLLDPAWTTTASMATARAEFEALMLETGKVMVIGGHDKMIFKSAELYDPATKTWAQSGSMGTGRYKHASAMLNDGRVLVTGGNDETAELYDPPSGLWTPVPNMSTRREEHTMTTLKDGRVLVLGGDDPYFSDFGTADLYDPATNAWTIASSTLPLMTRHASTRLEDGRVLATGGYSFGKSLKPTVLYTPSTGKFSSGASMVGGRSDHVAVTLPGGKIMVAGGLNSGTTTELYTPSSGAGTFASTGAMSASRYWFTATVLSDGEVVAIGGSSQYLATAESYVPAAGRWLPVGTMQHGRYEHQAVLLSEDNLRARILVMGGYGLQSGGGYGALSSAEVIDGKKFAVSCGSGKECLTGFCSDGICCDRACDGVCESCRASESISGIDGICGSMKADTDPDDECPDEGGCGRTGVCTAGASCNFYPKGLECKPTACGNSSILSYACDGAGTCVESAVTCKHGCLADTLTCREVDCEDDWDCPYGYECRSYYCYRKPDDYGGYGGQGGSSGRGGSGSGAFWEQDSEDHSSGDGGGCSLSSGAAGSASAWGLLIALLLVRRKNRSREVRS